MAVLYDFYFYYLLLLEYRMCVLLPPLCVLTVGDGEQCAVRCVHVTCCHIVPLSRPVNGGIVLDIKLLKTKSNTYDAYINVW